MPETKTLQDVQEWLEDPPTPWPRKWIQQGREEGLEEGLERGLEQGLQAGLAAIRRLLERQARARFGDEVVQPLRLALVTVQDLEQLDEISEWIEASASAEALLARLRTL